jgi:hypothetical protein
LYLLGTPENVKQPAEQRRAFEDLFASFRSQTDQNFTVSLVCNVEQTLPELPGFVERTNVSFPPNLSLYSAKSRQEAYESIRTDKGKRVRAGLDAIVPDKDIVMVCDDDDLLHRRFVEAVLSGDPNEIRFVEKGYKWISGTTRLSKMHSFHKSCGTSLVIPARYYKFFRCADDEDEAINELGSHILPFANMLEAGYPAKPLDFFAAAYRVRGSNSTQVQVEQASRYEHSHVSRFFHKTRARVKKLAKVVMRADQKQMETETLLAGDWFQRDFLGGRPVEVS